jgi:bifunctional enzyme CysN/CysC
MVELRVIVCGGAGAGKSTLLAHLAGRSTFLGAETPDDEEHLRRLFAEASSADLAIVVADARDGLLPQTRRDIYLALLLGVPRVVAAINKMDLVEYSAEAFARVETECREFAGRLGLAGIACVPLSATVGANVVSRSAAMPWYGGPSVMEHLEGGIGVRPDIGPAPDRPPAVADEFEATIVWMHQEPMLPGRSYLVELAGQTASAILAPLKYRVDVDTHQRAAARTLTAGEVGVCGLVLGRPVRFAPYSESRELGRFNVIDSLTGVTLGAGLLHFALRRAQNVHWQALDITKAARAALNGQRPCVVWFTGLSGAGKSTIANLLEKRLHALGRRTYLLDGDNVRHGLNKDLGFTAADRVENIRRVAEVSRLMVDAGLIVLVSFISPFRAERRMARDLVESGEFWEVFVDAPLAVAEARDPKGLYRKARRGELKNFTGVDSPYEPPEQPELRIDTACVAPEEAVEIILDRLRRDGVVPDASSAP